MTAFLIVRAEMADPDVRDDFDRWYQQEHLPDAIKAFAAVGAWRGWSEVETDVHYAFYEFDSVDQAKAIADSPAIKDLIAEFDRLWGSRVTRTRDIVEKSQQLSPKS